MYQLLLLRLLTVAHSKQCAITRRSKKLFEIGFGSYDEDLHSQGYAARPLEKYAKLKISIVERLADRQKIGKRQAIDR